MSYAQLVALVWSDLISETTPITLYAAGVVAATAVGTSLWITRSIAKIRREVVSMLSKETKTLTESMNKLTEQLAKYEKEQAIRDARGRPMLERDFKSWLREARRVYPDLPHFEDGED